LAVGLRPASAAVTPEQVRRAIDEGVEYLRRQQKPDGSWATYGDYAGGTTALCTLAMLNAGVPVDDPDIEQALGRLRQLPPSKTYVVALQTMALCAAEPKKDQLLIQQLARWLESAQRKEGNDRGGWYYSDDPQSTDNSNSQFAMLALAEAERVGVKVNDVTWQSAQSYWRKGQNNDGSWGYTLKGGGGSGSMTCAGITSMVIAIDKLGTPDAKVNGDTIQCCGGGSGDDSIDRALSWLGRYYSVTQNPGQANAYWLYYLYGLERVGRLTAQRFMGGHDWYREGADVLIQNQDGSGFWKGHSHDDNDERIATSYALLFLSKGRRPVLVNKLKHAPGDDWNNHRQDIANLTRYTESRWERDMTWQVVDVAAATVADLLQAPVVFINGRTAPQLTKQDAEKMREFVDAGGFIFAEACCDGDFDRGFREFMKLVFPEPQYELELLPPTHPVWSAEEVVDPDYATPLYGINVGCRTGVIYCDDDLSCLWELARPGRDVKLSPTVRLRIASANSIGINVLAYATNRELKYKEEVDQYLTAGNSSETIERAKLHIAKLRHTGGWDDAPRALMTLLHLLRDEVGVRVGDERHDLTIDDVALFDHHLAFMHGQHRFRLTEAERANLRAFIERGGMLMADAVCGSEAFAESFRREMQDIFPEASLEAIPADDPIFTAEFGGFDVTTVTRRDPVRRAADGALAARRVEAGPELESIEIDGRHAVIFSKYDISCALERHATLECRGYVREDAARIGINVVLYSLAR
jgi:hypothetical protein